MTAQTLLLRQIHPGWLQNNRVTSQAFRPTSKDNGLLSAYDGDLITPEAAWRHFTTEPGRLSSGVYAVSVAECSTLGLPARSDPTAFAEHAVIDFTGVGSSAADKKAKALRNQAEARGWLFQPAGA
jgi:hypothetical protein